MNTISLIQTWDAANIATAIANLKTDKTLERSVTARFQPLLRAIGGSTLKALANLPQKWEKMNPEKKAAVLKNYPADAPFFTNILQLNAKCRVDTWRDSHYSWQIPSFSADPKLLKQFTELHIEEQQWEALPDCVAAMENLEVLNLSCNKLRTLPDFILNFKKLRVLNLNQNYGLKTIPDISQLTQLERINFIYTDINTLPDGFFDLKNIKEVRTGQSDLDKNIAIIRRLITTFPDADIATYSRKAIELEDSKDENEYKNVLKIRLEDSNMSVLPETLFSANAVTDLKIRGWNLQKIPDLFDNLQTLEILDIELSHECEELPPSVFRLKNLKTFRLRGFAIKILPDNMEGLESLEELHIEHLRVEKLPESFKKLKNLKHLTIEYASYDVFSVITTLTNLETLKLERYHTPFIIAEPLTALVNLREVTLKFNQKITDDIYHLPSTIQKIRLQDDCWGEKESRFSLGKFLNHFNQATEISFDQINTADISEPILPNTALKTLSFSDTKMPKLPDTISNLINLDYFSLFRCSLDSLNTNLYDCKNLKYLRISQAQFTTIPTGISKLENLIKIGFEVSKITSLPDDIMEMKHLEKLNLDRTPLFDNKDFKTLIKKKIKGLKVTKGWYD